MARRIEETEVNNIVFCYQIGLTHTAVWTKEKDQRSTLIPDHYKMSFGFNTPEEFQFGDKMMRPDQIVENIKRRIRDKADEQKESGKHIAMKVTERKTKSRR